MKEQDIDSAIAAIMESLRQQKKGQGTFRNYETSFNTFKLYILENCIEQVNEKTCLDYIHLKTGNHYESFECVTANRKVDYRMRPLLLLLRYLEDGEFHDNIRRIKPSFICPPQFSLEYEAFCEELAYGGYSKATIESNTQKVQLLLKFLTAQGVVALSNVTIQYVENYLKTQEDKAVKYIGTFLYVFRKFFAFLYEHGYIEEDITPKLPKVRTPRNASIPYVWSKSDLQKLLNTIDREDPKGKRDYAILLIAIRLGLRIGDIRSLKKSSLNWTRQTINIKMVKTGQLIELPILKDVGWAIIDYLKNGRPVTNSECLFVRHKAPFNAFASRNAFGKELHRYIVKAGLNIPGGRTHGMHSLRSTLAGNMLDVKTPLPIISEALGHQSVNTTSIYLKIDLEGLRKCAVDPSHDE